MSWAGAGGRGRAGVTPDYCSTFSDPLRTYSIGPPVMGEVRGGGGEIDDARKEKKISGLCRRRERYARSENQPR